MITSEQLLDNASDLGRTTLILLEHPINSEKLAYCQSHQDCIVAFYVNFIDWLYKNFDRLQQMMHEDKTRFEYKRSQESVPYERVREHCFILTLTLKYILLYAAENELITKDRAASIFHDVKRSVEESSDTQIEIMDYVAKKSGEKPLNPSRALYHALRCKAIRAGDEGSDCFVRTRNGIEFLWIRSQKLTFELNKIFGYQFTDRYYIKDFEQKGILVKEASGSKNTRRFNGQRYLVIRLDILAHEAGSIESVVDTFL